MAKGVRKGKHHTLVIRFKTREAVARFVDRASNGFYAAYEADALDPEMEGIGRAPANTYVLREYVCDKPVSMRVD